MEPISPKIIKKEAIAKRVPSKLMGTPVNPPTEKKNSIVEENLRFSEMKPKVTEVSEEKKKVLSELTCAFLEFKRLELKTGIAKAEQDGYKVNEVELLKNISNLTKKQSFLESQIKSKEKQLFELELQTFQMGSQLGKTFEALQYHVNYMRENNIYPAARILEGLYKKMIEGPVEFSPQVIGFIENFRKVLPPLELSLQTKTILIEQFSLLQKKSETLTSETNLLEKKFDLLNVISLFFFFHLISLNSFILDEFEGMGRTKKCVARIYS